jgi:hypothetical protein
MKKARNRGLLNLEQAMGNEPSAPGWKSKDLPSNYNTH